MRVFLSQGVRGADVRPVTLLPDEVYRWCPFCMWALTHTYWTPLEDVEAAIQDHLDEHVEEMADTTNQTGGEA